MFPRVLFSRIEFQIIKPTTHKFGPTVKNFKLFIFVGALNCPMDNLFKTDAKGWKNGCLPTNNGRKVLLSRRVLVWGELGADSLQVQPG